MKYATKNNTGKYVKPGWNDNVKQLYKLARESFLKWKNLGRPVNGNIMAEMKEKRREFKKALKFIKRNEEQIRNDKLAESMYNKKYKTFWKEVRNRKK